VAFPRCSETNLRGVFYPGAPASGHGARHMENSEPPITRGPADGLLATDIRSGGDIDISAALWRIFALNSAPSHKVLLP
jgi:hypothetical protein